MSLSARTRVLRLGMLLVATGSAGCKAPPLPEGDEPELLPRTAAELPPFTLGPGDLLFVAVFGYPDLSTPEQGLVLDPDGRLSLPLLGSVPLAGLAPREAERELERRFARYLRRPDVSVGVLEAASRQFFLAGEVRAPGPKPLDRPLTALQALSLGDGLTDRADRDEVALLRTSGEERGVYFFNVETPDERSQVYVLPGDVLFVRRTGTGVFRDEVLPVLQGAAVPFTILASVALVLDRLEE